VKIKVRAVDFWFASMILLMICAVMVDSYLKAGFEGVFVAVLILVIIFATMLLAEYVDKKRTKKLQVKPQTLLIRFQPSKFLV